jgi:hypothetical protein
MTEELWRRNTQKGRIWKKKKKTSSRLSLLQGPSETIKSNMYDDSDLSTSTYPHQLHTVAIEASVTTSLHNQFLSQF